MKRIAFGIVASGVLGIIAILARTVLPAGAVAVSVGYAPALLNQFVGGGRWQSSQALADQRNWQVQIKQFNDQSLSGRISIVGAAVQQARIEGQVSGSQVYGVLVGDNNMQIGTFTGSIFTNGISGTYNTADGDSGNWSWDGPLPQSGPIGNPVMPTPAVQPVVIEGSSVSGE